MSPGNGNEQGRIGAPAIADLSRVAFFDGQRLAADDLNGAATVQRELRWLHNRSLHTWGIGLGFAVTGAAGDRQVSVSPGYAIDCLGREIILTESMMKAVPARADNGEGGPVVYYLVAAYPDDSMLTVLERRRGECGTDGAVRLREQAAIYWKASGEQTVELGHEIVLAQASVQNCQLAGPLSLAQRRSARPPRQPYVSAGSTTPGGTVWQPWTVSNDGGERVVGLTTSVDTTGARFGSTPDYQAQLRGQRFFEDQSGPVDGPFLLDGLTFLSEPTATGFVFSVILPRTLSIDSHGGSLPVNAGGLLDNPKVLTDLVQKHWSVVWVGVEG